MNWKNRRTRRTAAISTAPRCASRASRRRWRRCMPLGRDGKAGGPTGSIGIGPNGEDLTAAQGASRARTRRGWRTRDLVVPAGQRARYEAAFARFSAVFPDTFYVKERGRFYPDAVGRQGPPAERRLPQRDGLHPRRYAAQRADPGREGAEGAGGAVGSVRVRRGLHRPAPTSSSSSTRAARFWATAASRARFVRPIKDVTAEAIILNFKKLPVPREGGGRRHRTDPVAMRGDRRSLRPGERHPSRHRTGTARSRAAPSGRADDVCGARLSPAAVAGRARGSPGVLPLAARQEAA